jgi:hypothetical protein
MCMEGPCLRGGSILRYLAHMNLLAVSTLALTLAAPLLAGAQTGASAALQGAGQGGAHSLQGLEGGSLMPAGALMTTARPVAANDLRSVLQLQKEKARPVETAPPERHLSTQQRSELRQQLRQQREAASASN